MIPADGTVVTATEETFGRDPDQGAAEEVTGPLFSRDVGYYRQYSVLGYIVDPGSIRELVQEKKVTSRRKSAPKPVTSSEVTRANRRAISAAYRARKKEAGKQ